MKRIFIIITCLFALATAAQAVDTFPYTYNMTCSQGEDCRVAFSFVDASNRPVNLTGNSYAAMVRTSYTSSSPLATFTVTVDASAGIVTVWLPKATTTSLANKAGVWDLKQTDQNGLVTYIERGTFRCVYSATR